MKANAKAEKYDKIEALHLYCNSWDASIIIYRAKEKGRKAMCKTITYLPFVVRLTGLEPARRETLDPKSNASTNSATGAFFAEPSAKLVIII